MSDQGEGMLEQTAPNNLVQHNLKSIEASLDSQSYLLGEVPQHQLVDPRALLPLNSDRLIGSINAPEQLVAEAMKMIEEETNQIQILQRKISSYAEKIEKNKDSILSNQNKIKQNNIDIVHDKKNRDYWIGRAEEVQLDYQNASSSNHTADWAWIIKKYGLKNGDGTTIDPSELAVDELCNGETNNLISVYREAGKRYDTMKKDRESENKQLYRENASHLMMNEKLQQYITAIREKEIAPLEEGILLIKELCTKLGLFASPERSSTYGEMRTWAETFLNDFLKSNSLVPQKMASAFRKLTSIPLPADHS